MSNDLLNSIIDRQSNGGPRILHEEHDINNITIELPDFDGNVEKQIAAIESNYSWDAAEYGISKEQAIANIRNADTPEKRRAAVADIRRRAIQRANLNTKNGKVAMMAVGTKPWHGLGTTIAEAADSYDALWIAGLGDWNLTKEQCSITLDGKQVMVDSYAVVRNDTKDVLGVVGSRYKIVSNEECFSLMDLVIETGAKFETAGAVGKGEKVWMLARWPEDMTPAGDEHENYIMLGTSHNGTGAIWVYPTSVRVVCNNTYRLSMGGRRKGIHLRHTKNVKEKAKEVQKALGLVRKEFDEFNEQVESLIATPMQQPVQYFKDVLDSVLDVTVAGMKVKQQNIDDKSVLKAILDIKDAEKKAHEEKRYDKAVTNRTNLLNDIVERYESDRCNGNPALKGSAWAAVNAVTENADHSELWRYYKDDAKAREARFSSIMDGKAFEVQKAALELAQGA